MEEQVYITQEELNRLSIFDRIEYQMVLGALCREGFQELTMTEIDLYKSSEITAAIRFRKYADQQSVPLHTRITELEAINKSYETNTDNMHHLVEKLDNRIVELDGEKTVLTSRVAELETYIGGIQSDLEANFPDSFDRENLLLDIENFLGTTKP